MINEKLIEELTAFDQLNVERAEGRVFQVRCRPTLKACGNQNGRVCCQGFEEGKLTFAPTYKYIPGQDIYDQRPEKKMRCPAWCDRYIF